MGNRDSNTAHASRCIVTLLDLDLLPVCWEQMSEAWVEAPTSSCAGLSSQNGLQEALVDRASSSHPGGVGVLDCGLSTWVAVPPAWLEVREQLSHLSKL